MGWIIKSIPWLAVVLGAFSSACAGIILKTSAKVRIESFHDIPFYYIGCAVFFYVFSFVSYVLALRVFPVAITYSTMTAITVFCLALYSSFILDIPATYVSTIGFFLIFIGIWLLLADL